LKMECWSAHYFLDRGDEMIDEKMLAYFQLEGETSWGSAVV
jgi:hypothetical protein